jgi:hypothetical protein
MHLNEVFASYRMFIFGVTWQKPGSNMLQKKELLKIAPDSAAVSQDPVIIYRDNDYLILNFG